MGDLFGGGGGSAPPGYYESAPNPLGGVPGADTLYSAATARMGAAMPGLTSPYTIAQYGHGLYNPQTMAMQLPQFNPQQMLNPQMNPWIHGIPMNNALGGMQYNGQGQGTFNPQMMFQGLSNMPQGLPAFNPGVQAGTMPNFMGPMGPGGQQQPQKKSPAPTPGGNK